MYHIVNYWDHGKTWEDGTKRLTSSSGGGDEDLERCETYAINKSRRVAKIDHIDVREARGLNWGPIVARYANGEKVEL